MLHLVLAKRLRSDERQILNYWTIRKVLSFLFSGIQSHHLMANRWGKSRGVTDFIFLGSKITAMATAALKLKDTCSLEGNL